MARALPPPDYGNYLESSNPFGLSRPPAFFLDAMRVRDADLVIFPAMEDCVYRLCRRVKHGPPPAMAMALRPDRHPDMAFMARHRLVGITGILPFPHWGPLLLDDLAKMDMWRCKGGSDGFCDALERLEEEKRRRQDLLTTDEAEQRSISAFEALKLRTGSTTFVHQ
jgi:hypothetical protein